VWVATKVNFENKVFTRRNYKPYRIGEP